MVGTQNRRTFAPGQSPIGAAFGSNGNGHVEGPAAHATAPRNKKKSGAIGCGQNMGAQLRVKTRYACRRIYAEFIMPAALSERVQVRSDNVHRLERPTWALGVIYTSTITMRAKLKSGKSVRMTSSPKIVGVVVFRAALSTFQELLGSRIVPAVCIARHLDEGMPLDTPCAVVNYQGSPIVLPLKGEERILEEISLADLRREISRQS